LAYRLIVLCISGKGEGEEKQTGVSFRFVSFSCSHRLLFSELLRKTAFLSHLYIKTNILPRQARNKHRENSKKHAVVRTSCSCCFFEFRIPAENKPQNTKRKIRPLSLCVCVCVCVPSLSWQMIVVSPSEKEGNVIATKPRK